MYTLYGQERSDVGHWGKKSLWWSAVSTFFETATRVGRKAGFVWRVKVMLRCLYTSYFLTCTFSLLFWLFFFFLNDVPFAHELNIKLTSYLSPCSLRHLLLAPPLPPHSVVSVTLSTAFSDTLISAPCKAKISNTSLSHVIMNGP